MKISDSRKFTLRKRVLFLFAGAVGFVADATVFFSLLYFFQWHYLWCRLFASILAMTLTWQINRHLTFKNSKSYSQASELFRYIIASVLGAIVNLGILSLIFPIDQKFYHLPAYSLSALGGLLVNYYLYNKIVFLKS